MRKPRPFQIIGILFGLLFLSAIISFGSTTLPDTRAGITYLQLAQDQLAHNPEKASELFRKSSVSFERAFETLQKSPFVLKIITPLPPFRWYIHILKATHSLSLAGNEASTLSQSFPPLLPAKPGDLTTSLAFSSRQYTAWAQQSDASLHSITNHLTNAEYELDQTPTWIVFSERQRLETLKKQITATKKSVVTMQTLNAAFLESTGATNTNTHSWLIIFSDHTTTQNHAVLKARSGTVESVMFATSPKSLQLGNGATFNTQDEYLAKRYAALTHTNVDGVIRLDSSLLPQLLTITGPLTLPVNKQTVSNTTRPKELLTPAILPELLPALMNTFITKPTLSALPVFEKGIQDQLISVWSSHPELQDLISSHISL